MLIIGCDLHTRTQQIALLDTDTGEVVERSLEHEKGEAKRFYAGLKEPALVGIESTGYALWFAAMLAELGHELVVGDAAKIRALEPRQQKHDRRDAEHLLNLLRLLAQLDSWIHELDQRLQGEAEKRAAARRLMTHPGVGPLTALGTVLVLGPVERFPDARHVTSYVGLIPQEESSGGRQRFGHLTKQGNRLLRFLLVEAAQAASRCDPGLRRVYRRLAFRKGAAVAKVAVARKLLIRLYIMLRDQIDYAEFCRRGGSHAGRLGDVALA
jgi:transposase